MVRDPIVEEVRAVRQTHAKRFGYDLRKIAEDLMRRQEESGRLLVTYPPKPPRKRTAASGSM